MNANHSSYLILYILIMKRIGILCRTEAASLLIVTDIKCVKRHTFPIFSLDNIAQLDKRRVGGAQILRFSAQTHAFRLK